MTSLSMTGFGSATMQTPNWQIVAEIRSTNNRFFDCSMKLPEQVKFLETKIKTLLVDNIKRGKVELRVSLIPSNGIENKQKLNKRKINDLVQYYKDIKESFSAVETWSISEILKQPNVFVSEEDDFSSWESEVLGIVKQCVEDFLLSCGREGLRLNTQIINCIKNIEELSSRANFLVPKVEEAIRDRIKERLQESLLSLVHDSAAQKKGKEKINSELLNTLQERIRFEASIAANKIDIAEELARIKSHLNEMETVLKDQKQTLIGKRLDFLTQELHRESNTIGSKSYSIEQSKISIEMKLLIEQIKEQVQNLQ